MHPSSPPEEPLLLSFADILSLFRQHKFSILCWALFFGLVSALLALMTPIRYQAEGTFRDKGIKSAGVASSTVMQLLGGGGIAGESEAASLMTSHKILGQVIEELHLQASLEALPDVETLPRLLKHNLMLAWFFTPFGRSAKPILSDSLPPVKIDSLSYTGELPLAWLINLKPDGQYHIFDLFNKQSLGWGELGKPVEFDHLSLTLLPMDTDTPLTTKAISLSISPLPDTVKAICAQLKIEPTRIDKSLLKLKYEHRNRFTASAIINSVMASYKNYLKNYHEELAFYQLDYLTERRKQLTKNLTDLMDRHAVHLANGVNDSGFIKTDKEIDFLAANQYEYKRKLLDNELEIKRLTHIHPGNLAYYDRPTLGEGGDSTIINPILSDIRQLKQQRDSLEIGLQKKSFLHGAELQQSFERQVEELNEVQQHLRETRDIAQKYAKGLLPDSDMSLIHDPRFLLQGWLERLEALKNDPENHQKEVKDQFTFYLINLERSFEMHERILQERLTHQHNPSEDYQGISLEVATDLYLGYSKQLIQIEEGIRQNLFFIQQIEDPDFEISSLSAGLNDPVSTTIIQRASQLLLNLRDENNQSLREQERIKSELRLQRTFLTLHLKQIVQLMELNKQLFNEKIFALQNVSLELIHQRISLLEKNLQDYLSSRLNNLQQEKKLIQRQLDDVHTQMALLPTKWVSEKMLTQEVETHQRIVAELTALVESKNVSHKLEVIQSASIDPSIPPVHPVPPKVLLFSLMGFCLGGLIGSGIALVRALNNEK